MRQNPGNCKVPLHPWRCDSDLTWLEQPRDGPHEEAKHSRSPTRQKLLQWKLNMKKTPRRGSDKKSRILETGNQDSEKQTQQKAHVAQPQIKEDLWLR